jgi:hypothetical protein
MKTVSTALPAAPAFSSILDIRGLQPGSVLCKLSENLSPSDQVNVYGTLDDTATGASVNIALLGSVFGNQGDTGAALPTAGWPFLLAQRVTGSATGTFFVSGSAATGSPISPVPSPVVPLPGLTSISMASNGAVLPQSVINVASTTGFASSGSLYLPGLGLGAGIVVTYTGITSTSFTGCVNTSGTGATLLYGQVVQGFSAAINLQNFGSGLSVRVGLDKNSTANDQFNVYGTNDPAFVGTAGGELVGQIQGGGQNNGGNVNITNFQYVYVLRTSPLVNATAGDLLAWGADDTGSGSQGPLDLGSLAVGNTAVSGNLGTPPLTAAQSVDLYSSFVLTQVTGGGVNVTLPAPTNSSAGKIVFVSLASASANSVNMYGAALFPGFGVSLQWDGAEWTPVGVGDSVTTHGNLPNGPMQIGSLDGSDVNVIAQGGGVGTGNINLTATTSIAVSTGAGVISINAGGGAANTGNITITANGSAPGPSNGNLSLQAANGIGLLVGSNGISINTSGASVTGAGFTVQTTALSLNAPTIALVPTSNVTIYPAIGAANTPPLQWLGLARTFAIGFRAPNVIAADTTWILPAADGTAGAPSVLQTDGAGNLSFNQMQSGTGSIGATGVSAAIPANITANSRIIVTVKNFVASTAVGLEATSGGRTIGAPGSFTVTAYDSTAAAVPAATGTTFDWIILG